MTKLEWTEAHRIGVPAIDEDHQRILRTVDAFIESSMERKSTSHPVEHLLELMRCAYYHFRLEERLMQQTSFPEVARHAAKHDELFESLLGYLRGYLKFGTCDAVEVGDFLTHWFAEHLLDADQAYKAHFHAHGIR